MHYTYAVQASIWHGLKEEKDILIKMGPKFRTKINAHSWRSYTAIYAPFFQLMWLWRRARGYPNPWIPHAVLVADLISPMHMFQR